ncbi:MAG: CAP domain-containing protein [Clostridia bacterium]|nr:CAP domain-containing protein [Clostridia bacterium]
MYIIDFASGKLGRMLQVISAAAALLVACVGMLLLLTATAQANGSYTNEVIRLVNEERSKVGAPALRQHKDLDSAADVRAEEAARKFSHTRPNGSKWRTVFDEFKIRSSFRGENLAYGQPSPRVVVNDWMASPEHRKNILNTEFDYIAVGLYEKAGVLYWSQLFIQSSDDSASAVAGVEDSVKARVCVGSLARVVDVNLNVRASASSKARIVAVAEMGTELMVLEIQKDWAYVETSDGIFGWVSMKYIAAHGED